MSVLRNTLTSLTTSIALWVWLAVPENARYAAYKWLENRYHKSTYLGGPITRLPFNLALKWTLSDPHYEVANARFVVSYTRRVPIPTMHDCISAPDAKSRHVILMSWVEGETLAEWLDPRISWPSEFYEQLGILKTTDSGSSSYKDAMEQLDTVIMPTVDLAGSEQLMADLRIAIQELRSIPRDPPSSAVCRLDGGPWPLYRGGGKSLVGPFANPSEFHSTFFSRNETTTLRHPAADKLNKESKVCFTHADLHRTNILVHNGRLAAILDWENSAWLPDWFEYMRIYEVVGHRNPAEHIFWAAVGLFPPKRYRAGLMLWMDADEAGLHKRERGVGW